MKDAMDIKKALLQSLISSLKDAESEGIKNRPVSATVIAVKKADPESEQEDMGEGEDCGMEMGKGEEGSGEPEEMDLQDPETLARLKKLFGA